jgi:cell division topological specificity factor MinE
MPFCACPAPIQIPLSGTRSGPDYLRQLQQELLAVLAKYEHIDLQQVSVNLDRSGDCDVLELSVYLLSAESARISPAKPLNN